MPAGPVTLQMLHWGEAVGSAEKLPPFLGLGSCCPWCRQEPKEVLDFFFLAREPFEGRGQWGPLLHPEQVPDGMKADPLGTMGNLGHPSLCPSRQEVASTPSHGIQGSRQGRPSLVSSSRLGDILGGSHVLHEALIIELIGVRELYRQS